MIRNILKSAIIRNHRKDDFLNCSSSAPLYNHSDCSNLYDYWNVVRFETKGNGNDWVQIHIKTFEILPNSYTIYSFNNAPNHSHMRTWNLSASENGENWDIIDTQEDVEELNNKDAIKTFPLHNVLQSYSYFRITLIQSWDDRSNEARHRLSIRNIDFSGGTFPAITHMFDNQILTLMNKKALLMSIFIALIISK